MLLNGQEVLVTVLAVVPDLGYLGDTGLLLHDGGRALMCLEDRDQLCIS